MQLSNKNILITIYCAFIFFNILSCQTSRTDGGKKNPENQGGGEKNNKAKKITCEETWNQMVQQNPVGKLEQHENRSFSIREGVKTLRSKSLNTLIVTFNNKQTITWSNETETIFPNRSRNEFETTNKKDDFINNCKKDSNNFGPEKEDEFQSEQLGDEQVTVNAGTFQCTHTQWKPKVPNSNPEIIMNYWIAKSEPALIVKSIQNMKMRMHDLSSVEITETELIQFHR